MDAKAKIKALNGLPRPMSLQTSTQDSKNLQLLDIVKHGDVELLNQFLKKNPTIDINIEDEYLNQYPLKIAVQLQNEDMVDYILNIEGVQLKDSFLHAINTKNIGIISRLIYQKPSAGEKGKNYSSSDFPLYMFAQPLILACHNNHYATIYFIMSSEETRLVRDQLIYDKLDYRTYGRWWKEALCGCRQSHDDDEDESASYFMERNSMAFEREQLDSLRAAASPVYLSLCCLMDDTDLFLEIFCLCREADIYKKQYPIYMTEYQGLRQQLGKFAAMLLDQCQTQKEVECVLRKHHRDNKMAQSTISSVGKYPRLKLAMQWQIKEVIAHGNCQQVLEDMWTGGNHMLMRVNMWTWLCFYLPRLFLLPFVYIILFIYPEAFSPREKGSKMPYWKTPMAKFSSDMISYCLFLILLVVDVWTTSKESLGDRAPGLNGGLDVVIFIYMFSFIFEGIEALFLQGIRIVFTNWWMLHLWVMNILFMIYMVCRLVSYIITLNEDAAYAEEERTLWDSYDVMLWSESAYSVAIVLAFVKILYIFQDTKTFGPLQLSLALMIAEVSKTLIIYAVILVGFTFGMARLYVYYADSVRDSNGETIEQPTEFTSLYETFLSLFWLLFGVGSADSARVIVNNVCNNGTHTYICQEENYHQVIESAGYLLYVVYQLIGSIIMMRMLIALMTNALKAIQEKEDREWKFSRAGLWLTYFEQRGIFPNPLNVIPSPWGIFQSFKWCLNCRQNRAEGITDCCYPTSADVDKMSRRTANDAEYKKLTKRLAIAYLSGLEQQNLERSQLLQLVHGSNKKRFRNLAVKALTSDRKRLEEPIQEEEISPTRTGFLGAIKTRLPVGKKKDSLNENDVNANKVKGKLKKEDSATSDTSVPEIKPDSIELEEVQPSRGKKKRQAPTRSPAYDMPTFDHSDAEKAQEDGYDNDAFCNSGSETSESDTDHGRSTEA